MMVRRETIFAFYMFLFLLYCIWLNVVLFWLIAVGIVAGLYSLESRRWKRMEKDLNEKIKELNEKMG